jgi:hypothetical protein
VRLEGEAADVHRRVIVLRQKAGQPAAMVVMPVGKHCEVAFAQVDVQPPLRSSRSRPMAHIEQNAFIFRSM